MTRVKRLLNNHWFVMLLCCLIPLAALVAIVGFGVPVTTAALIGLLLICPVAHIVLMQRMRPQSIEGATHLYQQSNGDLKGQ